MLSFVINLRLLGSVVTDIGSSLLVLNNPVLDCNIPTLYNLLGFSNVISLFLYISRSLFTFIFSSKFIPLLFLFVLLILSRIDIPTWVFSVIVLFGPEKNVCASFPNLLLSSLGFFYIVSTCILANSSITFSISFLNLFLLFVFLVFNFYF